MAAATEAAAMAEVIIVGNYEHCHMMEATAEGKY